MAVPIRYDVDLLDRVHHLVRVTVTVPADLAPGARVVLSVWTPGSYVVRDYVHHVQQVSARSADGTPLVALPDGGTAWRLPDDVEGEVRVTLELYANDLTVRTNHVDDHHALLVPAATFPYIEGGEDRSHEVRIVPSPAHHRVFSLLPSGEPDTYVADHRDHLIDSAFEVGDLPYVDVEVADRPHRFVWAGHGGRPDLDRVASDLRAIGEACLEVFGGALPTDHYTILAVGWEEGGGGLEHRDGAVLQVPVHVFQDEPLYARFQSLLAHEYLHLWNVKRLVPADLVRPSYERPTRSVSLWVAEGWTAYYDELVPTRAGCWTPRQLLDTLQASWQRVRDSPGTGLQSLRQASYEAWTKHYVRDENSPNAMTDYYVHGSLVAFELDLRLRAHDPTGGGLDDVLRLLWDRHHDTDTGYTEQDVLDAVAEVGGTRLAELIDHRVGVPGPPELEEVVDVVGLHWEAPEGEHPPELGVEVGDADGGIVVHSVRRDGPAWHAAITGGDRLLALDERAIGRGKLGAVLASFAPGDHVEATVVRGPRLLRLPITLGAPSPAPRLAPVGSPDDGQRAVFERWTGRDLATAAAPTVP